MDSNGTTIVVHPDPNGSFFWEPAFIISVLISFQFFALVVLFGVNWIKLDAQLESTVIQTYVVAFTASWSYWLGTSSGSKSKDDTIKKQLEAKP